ncbi:DUF4352 domain-containing protein [Nocardia sp. NPDC020380]|uniref:DUF4352 domain-containing protein n=1 Tax=Nocardia sp. NPDC020380 TaxID=3364309 RepID=UPI0037975F21
MIKLASRFALLAAIASTVAVPAAAAGTPMRDNNFEYTITEVKNAGSRIDTGRAWRNAYGTFEVVTATITNIGSEGHGYYGPSRLIDNQGRGSDEDTLSSDDLNSAQTGLDLFLLKPAESVTFQMVFDVPTDTEPAYVMMRELSSAPGVKVAV